MKKKIFWGVSLIIIVAIFLTISKCQKDKAERNEIPLKAEFSNFQEINENYHSPDFQVKLLCESFLSSPSSQNPIRIFPSVNNNLVVECDIAKDEKSRFNYDFYKIDELGKIKDVFHFNYKKHYPHFINEFIVFTNDKSGYYSTWPSTGDITEHKMENLNDDFSWDKEKIEATILDIKNKSKYYFVEFDNITNYSQHFFYKDGEWNILWQKMQGYTQYSDNDKVYRYRNDVFETGNADSYLKENIKFLYFHPEEKMIYYHSGGGSTSYTEYNWRGKGFFQTKIGNKDFNYLIPKLVIESESHDGWNKRFYTLIEKKRSVRNIEDSFYSTGKDFAFFTNAAKKLYLIKMK